MFAKSIRWRFLGWLGFLLVGVLAGFAFTVYQYQRVTRIGAMDEQLAERVAALNQAVRQPPFLMRGGPGGPGGPGRSPGPGQGGPDRRFERPPPEGFRDGHGGPEGDGGKLRRPFGRGMGPSPFDGRPRDIKLTDETLSLFDGGQTNGFYFAVWGRDGTLLKKSTNAPTEIIRPTVASDTQVHSRMEGTVRESFQFTEMGDCVLAGKSMRADLLAMRRFAWTLCAAGFGILALGMGGGWALVTRAIRPISDITNTAVNISSGDLSQRIAVKEPENELGQLAEVLNSTFARLEDAFQRQRQFTADASHELRTPLSVIISEAQTSLARERSAAEYKETVEYCLSTAQQMRRLTASLLDLARFDAGEANQNRETVDLGSLTEELIKKLRPLAEQATVRITSDLKPALVMGNMERLSQVVTNLLTNAINYNKAEGKIHVTVEATAEVVKLSVVDSGQGISAEDLLHVFERFYRADKARSRAESRTGLGLAICQAIIQSHGGTISVTSELGTGTTFTVDLPAAPLPV